MDAIELLKEVEEVKADVKKSYKKYYEELEKSVVSEHKLMELQVDLERDIAKAIFAQKIIGKNAEEREASKRNLFDKQLNELDRLKVEVHALDGSEKLAMIDVEYVRMSMRLLELKMRLLEA